MTPAVTNKKAINVLLVEDNENDAFFTREAFDAGGQVVNLHHVDNGAKCLEFLRAQGAYGDAPRPDLILLDINMPVMDGREVLREIVRDNKLKNLPVVVLTTSSAATDIQSMYDMRCTSYLVKPIDFDYFVEMIRELKEYWFDLVALPAPA
ncbi:MAG TPA: response regulator [Polaromonas sp.]|uniref:response regulator n=1 Tax=Polaromonas sp. TaxID=1869339 RepID=UPI002D709ECC|nr:response regulator [Polaromonas sp.]HYW58857.1 response regulator [Polaromonas sp.]